MEFSTFTFVLISLTVQQCYTSNVISPATGIRHQLLATLHRTINDEAVSIFARQSAASYPPPTTNIPQCDIYDHYFYVTARNYTWQLRCSTNYEGSVIQQVNANNYSACIGTCIDYNRAHTAGSCLAITFNGPSDGASGLCTQYSDIQSEFVAYEEGNVQDSALLIYGPNGTQFATPLPDTSFSGQPTRPPTAIPGPSTTNTSLTPRTTITFSTTTVRILSCPPNVLDCATKIQPSTVAPTASGSPTWATHMSLPNGSPRPPPTTSGSTEIPTNTIQLQSQTTITSVMQFIEYRIQVFESCTTTGTSTPCTQYSSTYSVTGYRTQISCSPGACHGAMITTGLSANMAAMETCIAAS